MKLIFLFFAALSTSVTYLNGCNKLNLCQVDKNTVLWEANNKLTWKYFIGSMPTDFQFDANSSIKITLNYKVKNNKLRFTACTFFLNNESFYRSASDTTEYILNHEQKHFDIGEIYARVLRKNLLELSTKKVVITYEVISKLYYDCTSELKIMQDKYDKETYRSINFENQEIWNKRVSEMLDSLNNYKNIGN